MHACTQAVKTLQEDMAAQRKSLQARINELSRGAALTAGKLSEAQEEAAQLRMQLGQEREQHGKVRRAGPALLLP
jgi:peptidoglycan hydrolase CwlO-like protein